MCPIIGIGFAPAHDALKRYQQAQIASLVVRYKKLQFERSQIVYNFK